MPTTINLKNLLARESRLRKILQLHQLVVAHNHPAKTAAVSFNEKINQTNNSQDLENNRREIESWNG